MNMYLMYCDTYKQIIHILLDTFDFTHVLQDYATGIGAIINNLYDYGSTLHVYPLRIIT